MRGIATAGCISDILMAEDDRSVLLKELEALGPQVSLPKPRRRWSSGKAHHDAHCQPLTDAATLICHTQVAFIAACRRLRAAGRRAHPLLWSLPDATGQPAFDLPDGLTFCNACSWRFRTSPPRWRQW